MRIRLLLALLLLGPCAGAEHADGAGRSTHLSLLAGGSRVLGEDRSGATWGVDLEHELAGHFGVGMVLEHAGSAVDATTVLAVVDWHLLPGLVLQFGPGLEYEREREMEAGEHGDAEVRTRTRRSLVGRAGVFYEFELGRGWTLAPAVNVDVTSRHETLVWGLALGRRFRPGHW